MTRAQRASRLIERFDTIRRAGRPLEEIRLNLQDLDVIDLAKLGRGEHSGMPVQHPEDAMGIGPNHVFFAGVRAVTDDTVEVGDVKAIEKPTRGT